MKLAGTIRTSHLYRVCRIAAALSVSNHPEAWTSSLGGTHSYLSVSIKFDIFSYEPVSVRWRRGSCYSARVKTVLATRTIIVVFYNTNLEGSRAFFSLWYLFISFQIHSVSGLPYLNVMPQQSITRFLFCCCYCLFCFLSFFLSFYTSTETLSCSGCCRILRWNPNSPAAVNPFPAPRTSFDVIDKTLCICLWHAGYIPAWILTSNKFVTWNTVLKSKIFGQLNLSRGFSWKETASKM